MPGCQYDTVAMLRHFARRFPGLATATVASTAVGTFVATKSAIRCEGEEDEKKSARNLLKKMPTRGGSTSLTHSQQEEIQQSQLFEAYRDYFKGAQSDITEEDLRQILIGCGILDNHLVATFFHMLQLKEAKKGGKKKKAKAGGVKKETQELGELPDKVTYKIFIEQCILLSQGDDAQKIDFIFDFVDIDKGGLIDKYEMAIAVRHLLWCQTNWYGEEILYSGLYDQDLYFEVPTESIVQMKANKFAHDMIMSIPGASRSAGATRKQFLQFMTKGGKDVKFLKQLFSVLGAYDPPGFDDPMMRNEYYE